MELDTNMQAPESNCNLDTRDADWTLKMTGWIQTLKLISVTAVGNELHFVMHKTSSYKCAHVLFCKYSKILNHFQNWCAVL